MIEHSNASYTQYAKRSACLFLAKRPGALEGCKALLEIAGWRGQACNYGVLMGYFAALREGQRDEAKHCSTRRLAVVICPPGRIRSSNTCAANQESTLTAAPATYDDRLIDVHSGLGQSENRNERP